MSAEFLYVTPVLPWPPDQGSKLFLLEGGRALKSLGPVRWITREIGPQPEARDVLAAEGFDLDLDTSFVAQNGWARLRRRFGIDWRARRRGVPREEEFVCSPGVLEAVRRSRREMPQAIGVAAYWMASRSLEIMPEGRRVLVAADVESRAAQSALQAGDSRVDRSRVESLRLAESRAFARADLLLCLTSDDATAARALLEEERRRIPPIDVWPATLPMPTSMPSAPTPSGGSLRLLCYGHWAADFNRDGLVWFLHSIWPELRAAEPSLRLRLVGRGAEEFGAGIAGVDVVGWVEDLTQEFASADAVVLPLRWAGGLRYRMLEAMASGRPVLATPVAAAGSKALPAEHYVSAQTPEEWLAGLQWLSDPQRREDLAARAFAWVSGRHGPAGQADRLRRVLQPVLAEAGKATPRA